jgi:hypothetical protein
VAVGQYVFQRRSEHCKSREGRSVEQENAVARTELTHTVLSVF